MGTTKQDIGSEGVSFMFTIQRRRYREATGRKSGRLTFQSSEFGLNGVTGGYELNARFIQHFFFYPGEQRALKQLGSKCLRYRERAMCYCKIILVGLDHLCTFLLLYLYGI